MLLTIPVALLTGSMVALFLYLLELATQLRWQHQWLLFLLPLAGVVIVWSYSKLGKNAEAGNNLVLDEIHQPGGGVPARMTPLVLISTVITHLFGGSAGREGTAVQMGGSLAQLVANKLKLNGNDTRILLMSGVAAGFGAVFGTPVAGAIFALEVLAIGKIKYDAVLPCLIAAVLADMVCMAYGAKHTTYTVIFAENAQTAFPFMKFDMVLLLKIIVASICFGLVSRLFSFTIRNIKLYANKFITNKYVVPMVGGVLVIALFFISGTSDYLGLGVNTFSGHGNSIVNAFKSGELDNFAWLWKLVFTTITLSMGFKGGEVTPLFFIGATLGNTLAIWMGAPIDLFAALGFIAVFAGASNTPLACTLMGIELFGGTHILYYVVACFIAYYFSGHKGIYSSQRIAYKKGDLGQESEN